jgi:hypothetical protein
MLDNDPRPGSSQPGIIVAWIKFLVSGENKRWQQPIYPQVFMLKRSKNQAHQAVGTSMALHRICRGEPKAIDAGTGERGGRVPVE